MTDKMLIDFERAKHIRKLMLYAVAAPLVYETWGFGFSLKEMGENLQACSAHGRIDVTGFTVAELDALDFGRWSDDEGDPAKGLRLLPLWLYPYLKAGQELMSIDGSKLVLGDQYYKRDSGAPGYMDNDNRGGFLAYGVIPQVTA